MHVVGDNYNVKPFGGALTWPYDRLYLNTFYTYENLIQCSIKLESIKLKGY